MTLARRAKREKAPAIQLFNELFFEFTKTFQEYHTVNHGIVYTDTILWHKLQILDDKWRVFCNHILTNPKKRTKFRLDYLMTEANNHVDRVKLNELHKYLDKYMHTIEIPEAAFMEEIPSEMEELTEDQYIAYAGEMLKVFSGEQTIDDFKTNLVFKFLDIRHNRKKYDDMSELAKLQIGDNVYRIAELLDYFFILEEDKVKVNSSWTKCFIKKLGWIIRGPESALTDLSFLDYKDANTYYREFTETKSEESLNHLVAVMYRPKFLFWKMRYMPGKFFEWRSRQMKRFSFAKRFGVYLFFSACEEFLRSGTFKADGKDINLDILYTETLKEKQLKKKVKYQEDTGLTGLAYSLAKSGIYGNVDKVFKQNLYDVLVLLYQQRIEYLNQLENMDIKS